MKFQWVVILVLLSALLSVLVHPFLILAFLSLFLAVFFLARNLGFGLLLLVFFFPYLGLVVDFGSFEALREVPYLRNVNAPFVDIYGLVFFAAWVFAMLSSRGRRPWRSLRDCFASLAMTLPHWRSYLAFWLSGLISLFKVSFIQFAGSLKYFLRPFTFAYLMFFAMPVSILSNVKVQMSKVLTVFYFTGLLSAFNGLLGLLFGTHAEFPRAQPFGLFGVSPLGANHNLLAETLIATAPAGLLLSLIYGGRTSDRAEVRPRDISQWIRYGMWFQWVIALLTFARTAWIAVAVQALLYVYLAHRGRALRFLKQTWPVLTVFGVFLLILVATTFTETVRGSTLSRLDQARIAAFYFVRSPITGQGIGTFIPSLWQTKAFLLEYGEPVEAHGIIFKLMFEQGLLGLITFAVLIGFILRSIKKSGNVPALLIAAGSVAYQLFNTTYYTSKLWVPLAVALAIAKIYENSRNNPTLVS